MDSKLSQYAEQQLIEAAKHMSYEQRLEAYIEHCRQVYAFYEAGKAMRQTQSSSPSSNS